MRCPNCKKSKNNILQLHWTKKCHDFICGDCKLEYSMIVDHKQNINKQLEYMYNNYVEYELMDERESLEKKIRNMTYEEMTIRLKQLRRKR